MDSKHVITIRDEDEDISLLGGPDNYSLTTARRADDFLYVNGGQRPPSATGSAANDTQSVGSLGSNNESSGGQSRNLVRSQSDTNQRNNRPKSASNGYGPAKSKRFGGKKSQWDGYGHYISVTANRFDAGSLERLRTHTGANYFMRGQVEKGTATRREHLQMFLYQRNAKPWVATRDWVDNIIGFKGNEVKFCEDALHAQRTAEYANKDHTGIPGTRWESGQAKLPAFITNGPGAPEHEEDDVNPADEIYPTGWKDVIGLFGPNRTGKGHLAGLIAGYLGNQHVWRCAGKCQGQAGRWLGAYTGQPLVIIDEFDHTEFSCDYLKMMFDSSPTSLTTTMGGKSCYFFPAMIIFINNYDKAKMIKWFLHPQWRGRIKCIYLMDRPIPEIYNPPVHTNF